MEAPINAHSKKIYRLVLTGGPCGGKTTAQAMLTSVFEDLGWKVYRTPEVATLLFGGGVKITEMTRADKFKFEENLMKTTLQIEQVYCDLAMTQPRDVLLICDRGFMDAVAYLDDPKDWDELKSLNSWNDVDLRDKRYDQVAHLVTAADGADAYYTTANNTARSEAPGLAKELDQKTQLAWIGHPYFDVVDNSTNFEEKIHRLVRAVACRMGIDLGGRFQESSIKRKWLITAVAPDSEFPKYEDFDVQHIYLLSQTPGVETRIRKRGSEFCSYQITHRRKVEGRRIETRQQLSRRDYDMFATQRDMDHSIVEMRRRCFLYNNQYFNLDVCRVPANCAGLILLTAYTSAGKAIDLPPFLTIAKEVTDDPAYSMYRLSQRAGTEPVPAPAKLSEFNGAKAMVQ